MPFSVAKDKGPGGATARCAARGLHFTLYNPSARTFHWVRSSDGVSTTLTWGNWGDIPVAVDFDGDGKTDLAIYRPEDAIYWLIQSSNNELISYPIGQVGDLPVIGDFDGDRRDELGGGSSEPIVSFQRVVMRPQFKRLLSPRSADSCDLCSPQLGEAQHIHVIELQVLAAHRPNEPIMSRTDSAVHGPTG